MALTKLTTDLIDGSLGTDWVSTIQTSNFDAEAGKGYFINTTSAEITVTLPAGSVGAEIVIQDYAGTFATNKVILAANGSEKIQGSSTIQGQITTNNATAMLVYQDATKGWTSQDISLVPQSINVEYMLIGGGGTGGGGSSGGGGGAGGLYTGTQSFNPNESITITIGAGATTRTSGTPQDWGTNGNDSTITGLFSATAGGGLGNTIARYGGGTGVGSSGYPQRPGGAKYSGYEITIYKDGSGAGLGADGNPGVSTSQSAGADGGHGTQNFSAWAIATSTGEIVNGVGYYGGGGGSFGWWRSNANLCGNSWDCNTGKGGFGGGGDAAPHAEPKATSNNGAANTGGGGGNGSTGVPNGGSGICIVRYTGNPQATGGTIVTTGGYTYHTFTASGTFTRT